MSALLLIIVISVIHFKSLCIYKYSNYTLLICYSSLINRVRQEQEAERQRNIGIPIPGSGRRHVPRPVSRRASSSSGISSNRSSNRSSNEHSHLTTDQSCASTVTVLRGRCGEPRTNTSTSSSLEPQVAAAAAPPLQHQHHYSVCAQVITCFLCLIFTHHNQCPQ